MLDGIIKQDVVVEPRGKNSPLFNLNEIRIASQLFNTYGGTWKLLNEKNFDKMNPDYIWNSKLWDLKKVSSVKAVNSAVRKGIKQISENTGGLIIEVDANVDLEAMLEIMNDRIKRSIRHNMDVIVIQLNQVKYIFRYNKKK